MELRSERSRVKESLRRLSGTNMNPIHTEKTSPTVNQYRTVRSCQPPHLRPSAALRPSRYPATVPPLCTRQRQIEGQRSAEEDNGDVKDV